MTPRFLIRREGKWVPVSEAEFRTHQPKRGLGDIVHDVLKPFVRGTRFENCSGCARRRATLNRISGLVTQNTKPKTPN
jgi:hypothetical protein